MKFHYNIYSQIFIHILCTIFVHSEANAIEWLILVIACHHISLICICVCVWGGVLLCVQDYENILIQIQKGEFWGHCHLEMVQGILQLNTTVKWYKVSPSITPVLFIWKKNPEFIKISLLFVLVETIIVVNDNDKKRRWFIVHYASLTL